jgi:hypothetical protein
MQGISEQQGKNAIVRVFYFGSLLADDSYFLISIHECVCVCM